MISASINPDDLERLMRELTKLRRQVEAAKEYDRLIVKYESQPSFDYELEQEIEKSREAFRKELEHDSNL